MKQKIIPETTMVESTQPGAVQTVRTDPPVTQEWKDIPFSKSPGGDSSVSRAVTSILRHEGNVLRHGRDGSVLAAILLPILNQRLRHWRIDSAEELRSTLAQQRKENAAFSTWKKLEKLRLSVQSKDIRQSNLTLMNLGGAG